MAGATPAADLRQLQLRNMLAVRSPEMSGSHQQVGDISVDGWGARTDAI